MGYTNYKKAPLKNYSIARTALAEDGYNYYIYVHPKGQVIVMRENIAETEYKFADGGLSVATAYTNKVGLDYKERSAI